ncbi:ATP-dependent (S)-NAD(P)H-hydrate dehydratase [Hypsibius exemplaris]|uniref:ATP-dependent (S)-NAD(P)H-hydrate dehydratase n=1 Tax=Hypsibius exemplaris TaxID=2072580 RepID=A0A9X6NA12_HYPEX|nr:ATP-dependent (S)-NAD(P)H-hydrate dehydratase [Hypsibius exemplaris]
MSEDGSQLPECVPHLFPELTAEKHKGQAGRVGVIGGSEEYTGAPYFAAVTAMKVGADQAHVFCAKDASVVIKSYSPDLIVHPTLDGKTAEKDISSLFERLSVLIVGPGLGRTDATLKTVESLIKAARELELPIVIDADGLWLVNQKPEVIKGYQKAILTPNLMEAKRLWIALKLPEDQWDKKAASVKKMSQQLGNVGLIVKGPRDIFSDGVRVLESSEEFGLKRCGGQGDIMSGAVGVFYSWALQMEKENANAVLKKFGPVCCAAYAASLLTRRCSRLAFEELGRSMLASDMLKKIPQVVNEMQGTLSKKKS